MKFIATVAAIFLLLLTQTCNTNTKSSSSMEITGTIEAIQMTSWQYGTHTISNDTSFYALRSGDIDLSKYEGKIAIITAKKIEGYPVDGGPEFLEVETIKDFKQNN